VITRIWLKRKLSEINPRHNVYMCNPNGDSDDEDEPSQLFTDIDESQIEERPERSFVNGSYYVGQWLGTRKHGYGVHIWKDGAKFEGNWRFNKAYGIGKFTHINGDILSGQWKDSKVNGHAEYKHWNGSRFEGNYKDDL
jgi:hypothetical protein